MLDNLASDPIELHAIRVWLAGTRRGLAGIREHVHRLALDAAEQELARHLDDAAKALGLAAIFTAAAATGLDVEDEPEPTDLDTREAPR